MLEKKLTSSVLAALALAACDPDLERPSPPTRLPSGSASTGSGGGTGSTGTGAGVTSGGVTGGGDGGGGGACESWEPCTCAPCDEQGGTCLIRCNFGAGYDCYTPGPPGEGEFSCGGFENCQVGEACIDVEQGGGDSCIDHFCAVLPDPCAFDRTCACLAQYIDDPISALGPGTCTDAGGEIHVTYVGGARPPPWDEPWCGDQTCAGAETCWYCLADAGAGSASYVCAEADPGPDGDPSCSRQWGEQPLD